MTAPGATVVDLQEQLSRRLGQPLLVYLTGNRRRMVSTKRSRNGLLEVRLQRLFLHSPPEVLDDLAGLVAGRQYDRGRLRGFVDTYFSSQPDQPPVRRIPAGRTSSENHNITEYARQLNATYLGGRSTAQVVWGRKNRVRSKRSIRFGCYDPSRNLIILNRKLDSPGIPAYFVEYILFHEMLHEVLGIGQRANGTRDIHGSLFKLMESTFPDFDKARRFEKLLCKNLSAL